jgi:hypothetical protein
MKTLKVIAISVVVCFAIPKYCSSYPIIVTHEGKTFTLPVSLDSLNALLQFDSIYFCNYHTGGFITEKYDSEGAATMAAFYHLDKRSHNLIGLSFYYPIDTIQNQQLKERLEKRWDSQFKYNPWPLPGNDSTYIGYKAHWFMPIGNRLTILLFDTKQTRHFIELKDHPDWYNITYEYKPPSQFVVAYVRYLGDEDSFYYKYSDKQAYVWDD